jgi:hypothetical protein
LAGQWPGLAAVRLVAEGLGCVVGAFDGVPIVRASVERYRACLHWDYRRLVGVGFQLVPCARCGVGRCFAVAVGDLKCSPRTLYTCVGCGEMLGRERVAGVDRFDAALT